MNAFKSAFKKPQEVKFALAHLKNPGSKIETRSFKTSSMTFDGYYIDSLLKESTINFKCAKPCKSCLPNSPTKCKTCFSGADLILTNAPILHKNDCMDKCPVSLYVEKSI